MKYINSFFIVLFFLISSPTEYIFNSFPLNYISLLLLVIVLLNFKKFINNSHVFYLLIFFVLISAYLFYQDLVQNDFLLSKLLPGQEHHIARFGNGPYYFLYGFYLNVFLIWLFLFKGFHSAKKTVIFLSLCLLVAFLESTLFGTRRPLYLVLMAFLTAAILKPNLLIFGKRFY